MPSPVQDIAPGEALVRRYGILGSFPLQIDGTIVPVSLVDDLCTARERLAAGAVGLNALAVNFQNLQLFNPTGSGVLVTMERIWSALGAAGSVTVQPFNTALTTDGPQKQWRDGRLAGNPIAQVRTQNNAASLGVTDFFFEILHATASELKEIPMDVVLLPGQGIVTTPAVVNVTNNTNFTWKETTLLPGER